MTKPLTTGNLLQSESMAPPVWQPQPRVEPIDQAEEVPAEEPEGDDAATELAIEPRSHAARRAPARRANSVTALLVISAMVALGGVAFAVGRVTSTGQSGTGQAAAGVANGQNDQIGVSGFGPNASGAPGLALAGRAGGFGGGSGTISGTVMSVTPGSITIQESTGQTVTVSTGSSTAYNTQVAAASSDVTTGATVLIQTTTTSAAAAAGSPSASASPGTTIARTATSVTITAT